MPKAKRKNASGTTWTDADYAAHGYVTVKLRLQRDVAEAFSAEADALGVSRAAALAMWVEAAKKRRTK